MAHFCPVATAATLRATLAEHGVAVVRGVVPKDECAAFKNEMTAWIKEVVPDMPLDLDDPSTHTRFKHLYALHGGLIQRGEFSYHPACMDLRTHPRIVALFRELWGEDKLVGSKDGINVTLRRPNARTFENDPLWLHLDQSPVYPDFLCAQAYVDVAGTGLSDGTLAVLKGSHKLHAEFGRAFNKTDTTNWVPLNDAEIQWYKDRGCEFVFVGPTEPGDVVFWDSRTVHQGARQRRESTSPYRMVLYVCYVPAKFATESDYKMSRKLYEQVRCTRHWPAYGFVGGFSATPRTYGNEFHGFKKPPRWEGTKEQRQLLHLERYEGVPFAQGLRRAAKRKRT